MIKRTTVRLPAELLKRAQRKAAAEGRTLTGLMEEGLRYVVSDKPEKKYTIRPSIPVSAETNEQPARFLTFKEVQELDDLEYIEKLKRGFR
jgi:hypothetical protein